MFTCEAGAPAGGVDAGVGEGRAAELADVIAHLEQRRDNAAAVALWARSQAGVEPFAEDRRRQLDVVIDELRAGLHLGKGENHGTCRD